jgi:acetyl esterase/lipase
MSYSKYSWRFWTGAALFLLAMTTLGQSLARPVWMIGLAMTEWCYAAAPFCLIPLFPPWRKTADRWGAGFGLAGFLLLMVPLLQARAVARALPGRLASAFGDVEPRETPNSPAQKIPFSLSGFWRAEGSGRVIEETISFPAADETSLSMDLYRPMEKTGPAPVLIVVHGGSWRSGDRTEMPELNRYLAARGYIVASIDYRLAPAFPFPAPVEDAKAALRFLKSRAEEYGLNPEKIVFLGRSAGGQVALMAAYTAQETGVRGAVAIYTPADLKFGYEIRANPLVINSRKILETYLGGKPAELPEVYKASSPVNFVGPATPPTLIIHGDRDALVSPRHSAFLASALAGMKRPHLLLRLPWASHGGDIHFTGPSGQISTYAIERFLAAVTR